MTKGCHIYLIIQKTKTIIIDREGYFMPFLVLETRFSGEIQIKTEHHQVAD
jgi:hypothetical protein